MRGLEPLLFGTCRYPCVYGCMPCHPMARQHYPTLSRWVVEKPGIGVWPVHMYGTVVLRWRVPLADVPQRCVLGRFSMSLDAIGPPDWPGLVWHPLGMRFSILQGFLRVGLWRDVCTISIRPGCIPICMLPRQSVSVSSAAHSSSLMLCIPARGSRLGLGRPVCAHVHPAMTSPPAAFCACVPWYDRPAIPRGLSRL